MNDNFKKLLMGIITLALTSAIGVASPLSASEGRASQRAGTKLVDVYYDISGGVPPYTVTLQGSLDGGATWTLPVTSVSGNVGSGVAAGTNRKVTWDAGADWAVQVSGNVRFRVNVTDSATPPAPDGFALIPAGEFQMGDSFAEGWGGSYERPVHTVNVSAFYMAKHETTKALWDEVRAWGLNNGYTDLPSGGGKGANHPVHSVSWFDIVKWCNARSERDGLVPVYTYGANVMRSANTVPTANWSANGYRLPTEAEWEKAARGGLSGRRFPWGDTISHSQANYSAGGTNYGNQSGDAGSHPTYNDGVLPYSSPVGSFAPNGYGLYDMAGNMWEWCWDWYWTYPSTSQSDPRGPTSGSARVFRGGSWGNGAFGCRSAYRLYDSPTFRNGIGFRAARSSVPQ